MKYGIYFAYLAMAADMSGEAFNEDTREAHASLKHVIER
jgi:hypothetical protein